MASQVVATPLLKLVEEPSRPVRLPARIIHLVRIVEERAKTIETVTRERAIESFEVVANRIAREVIDDVAFAARRRPLDQLAVPSEEDSVESPGSGRRGPLQPTGRTDMRRQINGI